MATFIIGQAVWLAQFESTEKHVTCADCGGTKHLRVILFDGTSHTIECEGCTRGWRGPVGYNTVHHREAVAVPARITGVELDGDGITYKTDRQWYVAEANVFATEAEALARAAEKAERPPRHSRGGEAMTVDEKSAELAKHFLSDVEGARAEDVTELAEAIQRLCEDFCASIEESENLRQRDLGARRSLPVTLRRREMARTAASDDTATRVRLLIEQHMLDVTPRATYDPASVRVNAATLGEVFASMLDQARAEALEEAASVVLMTPLFKGDLTVKSSKERDERMAAAIRTLQGGSDAG